MIQCGGYILAPDFIMCNRKLDLEDAESLWNLVHNPNDAVLSDICKLLFDPRSYGTKVLI
jgi:hypothetical protein